MPLNKEALIRYRIINKCLAGGKYATRDEMIDACREELETTQVSKRTIDKDLEDMRYDSRLGYFAPIAFDRFRRKYYYETPEFSIDNIPLNDDDLRALSFAAAMLRQFKDIPTLNTFAGAVEKIGNTLKIRRFLNQNPSNDFIEIEEQPTIKGSEYLDILIDAIATKKVIDVEYKRFTDDITKRHTIHPYLLKEYRNRWYLVGHHHTFNEIRTYSLDRIVDVYLNTTERYIISNFDHKEFYRNTVGIYAPQEEPVEVVLQFSKDQGHYITSQPIHHSQQIVSDTGKYTTISLKVTPTYELYSLILAWSPDVKVIKPKELQEKIKEMLKQALNNY
jgi:predicted DNA-binding transcriptional regulator YafY